MEIETIVKVINSVGFPIVVSGALFWLNVTVMRGLRTALEEHTKVINRLLNRIEGK